MNAKIKSTLAIILVTWLLGCGAMAASAESDWTENKNRADRAFNDENWPVAETQYRRALTLAKSAQASAQELADLYNQLGRTLYQRDSLDKAREAFQQGLDLHSSGGSAESTDAAAIWFNLGHVHADLEQAKEAEFAYQRCLSIEEKLLGKNDPEVAVSLDQLGSYLARIHEFDRADPYIERAVAIRRRNEDPLLGESLKDWAINRYRLEDYEKAVSLAQQAIEISTDDALNRGLAFNVIAMCNEGQGNYSAAGANYRHALRLLREALGYQDEQFKSVAGNYVDMAIDHESSWAVEAPE